MEKRLMIFGGSGFVGGNMTRVAQKQGWKVFIADSAYRTGLDNVEWRTIDITEADAVDSLMSEVKPHAVVNVAAIADVDKAEREKELAWKVNVEGAANVAAASMKQGARYIYFSSDAVFDGEGSGYSEETPVEPVNYYGKTKAEGERAVFEAYPKAVVIRISLVIGFPVTGGNSFFAGLEQKLSAGSEILCPPEEVRTPVDVLTLSECVLELAGNDFSGLLHIGAIDSINRYELTRMAASKMGFDTGLVRKQAPQEGITGRAPRHRNGIINVKKAQTILETRLLNVEEGVERAFSGRL